MSRRGRAARRAMGLVALLGATACGDDGDGAAIEVRAAWARPTPAGTATAAVYMTVLADEDDTLVGASVAPAVAGAAIAHQTVSADGQLSMSDTARVPLPGGDRVRFEPGGLHVMLDDLAAPLVVGAEFAMSLDFADAPNLEVTVEVREDAP